MPAPRLKLNDRVVARDGSKGVVVKTIDFGASAPPQYSVRFENGTENVVDEEEISLAPEPPATKPAKPADAGATAAPGTTPPDAAAA